MILLGTGTFAGAGAFAGAFGTYLGIGIFFWLSSNMRALAALEAALPPAPVVTVLVGCVEKLGRGEVALISEIVVEVEEGVVLPPPPPVPLHT